MNLIILRFCWTPKENLSYTYIELEGFVSMGSNNDPLYRPIFWVFSYKDSFFAAWWDRVNKVALLV